MKIRLLISTVSILMLAGSSFANTFPKPDNCPSIAAVTAVGFDKVEKIQNSWAVSRTRHNFGTNSEWSFAVMYISAANEIEAMTKGAQSLNTMALVYGPVEVSDGWTCMYLSADKQLPAISHTPSLA